MKRMNLQFGTTSFEIGDGQSKLVKHPIPKYKF